MKNIFLGFTCNQCRSGVCRWTKLPQTEMHAYRVTCNQCGRFAGWGTEAQLQSLLLSGQKIETAEARIEPPGASFEQYY